MSEPMTTEPTTQHEHEWERGAHMSEAFGVDGRRPHCAICGTPRPLRPSPSDRARAALLDELEAAADDVRYGDGNGTSDYWRGFNDGIAKYVALIQQHREEGT